MSAPFTFYNAERMRRAAVPPWRERGARNRRLGDCRVGNGGSGGDGGIRTLDTALDRITV